MIRKILALTCIGISSLFSASLVETTTLKKGDVNPLQEFVGTVKFERSSILAAQNSGVVKSVNFEVGDIVKRGKTLVNIDADVLSAQINAARANLKSAKDEQINSSKDYARYKKLLSSKSITQKEYDDALLKRDSSNSKVKALQASLKELEVQNSKKHIKAPYGGTIVNKQIDLGEWVNAGTAIATIVDTKKAEITFNVPLNVFNGLKKGSKYDILVGNKVLKSTLKAAVPQGDKLTRTFPVKFSANTNDTFIFEGQEAKVSLSKNAKKQAFILPRDAVIKQFGQNVVFTIDAKNLAQKIPVQIVAFMDNKVAVLGKGLVEEMIIVTKGNERIFPNMPVKIINKK